MHTKNNKFHQNFTRFHERTTSDLCKTLTETAPHLEPILSKILFQNNPYRKEAKYFRILMGIEPKDTMIKLGEVLRSKIGAPEGFYGGPSKEFKKRMLEQGYLQLI